MPAKQFDRCDFDIAVLGAGFAGSIMAMIAKRMGYKAVLIERGTHPRFAIGESSTPLANLLLEELAQKYCLPRIAPLSKWGTWQQTYPEVACGLKRGFTFFHHQFRKFWEPDLEHRTQLLVAASPNDRIADTHWYRPDFDHFLVQEAQATGVKYLDRTEVQGVNLDAEGALIRFVRESHSSTVRVRFILDATGQRGVLQRLLSVGEHPLQYLPATEALFAHFEEVERLEDILPVRNVPPYPPDDAALHHVFDGGWIWVLRFNNGLTSAGITADKRWSEELNLSAGAVAWQGLLDSFPTIREQFQRSRPVTQFVHIPRVGFRSAAAAGTRWALLPSAAGFVDPLLSTGFSLTLLGIARIARALEHEIGTEAFQRSLEDYDRQTFKELESVELLVAALYANMKHFKRFSRLTLLYFAAVSYSETARRLNKPELASSFLLCDHPEYFRCFKHCCRLALQPGTWSSTDEEAFDQLIFEAIRPFDVAGLCDIRRRNWYPAQASDLFASAHKLGVAREEIADLLRRCGF